MNGKKLFVAEFIFRELFGVGPRESWLSPRMQKVFDQEKNTRVLKKLKEKFNVSVDRDSVDIYTNGTSDVAMTEKSVFITNGPSNFLYNKDNGWIDEKS